MLSTTSSFDLTNLLLGLAWLGELDREQIERLWFADKSVSTVEKTLAQLRKKGLIAPRAWSIHDPATRRTAPQLARWSLTPTGHALVKASNQYPLRPMRPRQQRLIPHDARTTQVIVRLIELARRGGLSGIFVAHEVRLDLRRTRPVVTRWSSSSSAASPARTSSRGAATRRSRMRLATVMRSRPITTPNRSRSSAGRRAPMLNLSVTRVGARPGSGATARSPIRSGWCHQRRARRRSGSSGGRSGLTATGC
jgi:hypothetical protein